MIPRLYLLSPDRIDSGTAFAEQLRAALDGGDVAAFQLHLPESDDATIARLAERLRPLCQERDVAFLLGGRPDLTVALECDGVEVRAEDYAEARRLVGPDRQVGIYSPASRHFAMEAADAGADYVAFDASEVELVEWWGGLFEVPCVAVGDVTLANAAALIAAGADFLGVSHSVWTHEAGPQAAVRAFNDLFSADR
jgi:thiamine-phosphate pyrophosphorylase